MAVNKKNMRTTDIQPNGEPITVHKAYALACRFLADYLGYPPDCEGELDKQPWECWQEYLKGRSEREGVCRVCGCTQDNACGNGCCWVEPDLCNHCIPKR